eukprot:932524-Amphidinium_carterae.1
MGKRRPKTFGKKGGGRKGALMPHRTERVQSGEVRNRSKQWVRLGEGFGQVLAQALSKRACRGSSSIVAQQVEFVEKSF